MNSTLLEYVYQSPPGWAQETICEWETVYIRRGEVDMLDFVTRETFEHSVPVDMREVIGQCGHYAGQTWLEAVRSPQYRPGKMRSVFRMYDINPSYYFNGDLKGGICLSSINGGPWFSDSGGNHRTVVAKFASERIFEKTGNYPHVAGVSKHYYYADTDAYNLFRKLLPFRDLGVHVSVERRLKHEIRVAGRNTADYEPMFFVSDSRFGRHTRSQWLSSLQFRSFARHVLKQNGKITRRDRFKHYWLQFGRSDFESLIYTNT